jgi:hypothetical protein
MKYKKILLALELIEGELDDAFYQLPEYNANSGTRDAIDCARSELYCLKDDIERALLDEDKVISGKELEEVMNTSPTLAKLL